VSSLLDMEQMLLLGIMLLLKTHGALHGENKDTSDLVMMQTVETYLVLVDSFCNLLMPFSELS
jgi:hypothetical protein